MLSFKNAQNQLESRKDEKTESVLEHLWTVFDPNNIKSDVHTTPSYLPKTTIKLVSSVAVAQEIDNDINSKKDLSIDEISLGLSFLVID